MSKIKMSSDDPKPRTFESIFSDIQKIFNLQLQTFTVEFVDNISSEELEAMLPEDIGEIDKWIEEYIDTFTQNEEPDVEEMVQGSAAIFMMAFLEKLFDHLNIDSKDDSDDSDDGDSDGDEPED